MVDVRGVLEAHGGGEGGWALPLSFCVQPPQFATAVPMDGETGEAASALLPQDVVFGWPRSEPGNEGGYRKREWCKDVEEAVTAWAAVKDRWEGHLASLGPAERLLAALYVLTSECVLTTAMLVGDPRDQRAALRAWLADQPGSLEDTLAVSFGEFATRLKSSYEIKTIQATPLFAVLLEFKRHATENLEEECVSQGTEAAFDRAALLLSAGAARTPEVEGIIAEMEDELNDEQFEEPCGYLQALVRGARGNAAQIRLMSKPTDIAPFVGTWDSGTVWTSKGEVSMEEAMQEMKEVAEAQQKEREKYEAEQKAAGTWVDLSEKWGNIPMMRKWRYT